MGYIKGDTETWSTGLSDDVWDVRPKEQKRTNNACQIGDGEWRNNYGEILKVGMTVTIKRRIREWINQEPDYTDEMNERYAGGEYKIKKIKHAARVRLMEKFTKEQIGFIWNIDWLEPLKPLEDDLFEI